MDVLLFLPHPAAAVALVPTSHELLTATQMWSPSQAGITAFPVYCMRLCVKEESGIWGVKVEGLRTTLKCLQRVLNGALWEEAWGGASLSPENEPAGHLSCLWPFGVFLRVFLLWTARHSGKGGPQVSASRAPQQRGSCVFAGFCHYEARGTRGTGI